MKSLTIFFKVSLIPFLLFAVIANNSLFAQLTLKSRNLQHANTCNGKEGSAEIVLSNVELDDYFMYRIDNSMEKSVYVNSFDSTITVNNLGIGIHNIQVRSRSSANYASVGFTIIDNFPKIYVKPNTNQSLPNGSITIKGGRIGDGVWDNFLANYVTADGKKFEGLVEGVKYLYFDNSGECESSGAMIEVYIPKSFDNGSLKVYIKDNYNPNSQTINFQNIIDSIRYYGNQTISSLKWYDSDNNQLIATTNYPQVPNFSFLNNGNTKYFNVIAEGATGSFKLIEEFSIYYSSLGNIADIYYNNIGCGSVVASDVLINDTDSGFYSTSQFNYIWIIDNQAPLISYEPDNRVLNDGEHTVVLEIRRKADGMLMDYDVLNFTIEPYPVVVLEPTSPLVLCPGEEFRVNVRQNGNYSISAYIDGNYTYDYDYKDQYNRVYYFKSSVNGNHKLEFVYYNYCDSENDTVSINFSFNSTANPVFPIIADKGKLTCAGDDVRFRSSQLNFKNVLWDFNDGTTSTEFDPVHKFTNSKTQYLVKLTATNTCGKTGTVTDTIKISTNLIADAGFRFSNNYNGNCITTPIRFEPFGSGSYIWNFGDGSNSTNSYPVKAYDKPGNYNVKLIVTNGCGSKDSMMQSVIAEASYNNHHSYIGISNNALFEGELGVCPGTKITFKPEIDRDFLPEGIGAAIAYDWILPDGSHKNTHSAEYTFSQNGEYKVVLNVANDCGGVASTTTLLNVTDKPENVSILYDELFVYPPTPVCPGDQVVLVIDDDENSKFTINWGDGQTSLSSYDEKSEISGSHTYTNPGKYWVSVTGKNCISPFIGDSVVVTSNNLQPISTSVYQNTRNYDYESRTIRIEKLNSTDVEVSLPVRVSNWTGGKDSTLYIYMWYGKAPSNPGGPEPNMIFRHKIKSGASETLKVYIPYDSYDEDLVYYGGTVGFAIGYNCDGSDDMPQYSTAPIKNGFPVYSYPFIAGGKIVVDPMVIADLLPCNGNEIDIYKERGARLPNGSWNTIEFYQGSPLGRFNFDNRSSTEGSSILSGYFYFNLDTISFVNDGFNENDSSFYLIKKIFRGLIFNKVYDTDTTREKFLSGKVFGPFNYDSIYNDEDFVCPGDSLEFMIFGGKSFKINYGDGTPEETHTNKNWVMHKYSNPGRYKARIVFTNGCGRTDTSFTYVNIKDGIKDLYIDFEGDDEYQIHYLGDTTIMRVYSDEGASYQWHFSDNNQTLIGETVKHIWTKEGIFEVKVTVSDACGNTNSALYNYTVRNKNIVSKCYVGIFQEQIDANQIRLSAIPFTNMTKYTWNLGDGKTSNLQTFDHLYANAGNYKLVLDAENASACIAKAERDIYVSGDKPCSAEFEIYNQNGYEFEFKILGENYPDKVEWDFGDGNSYVEIDSRYQTHIYKSNGWFLVTATSTTGGCNDTYSMWVEVKQSNCDSVSFVVSDLGGYQVKIKNTSENKDKPGKNFRWTFSDGGYSFVKDSFVYKFGFGGDQWIQLEMSDDSGCYNYIYKDINLFDENATVAFFEYSVSADTLILTNKSKNASVWFWTLGDGRTSPLKEGKFIYSKPGVYDVCLTIQNPLTGDFDEYCETIKIGNTNCVADFTFTVDNNTKTVIFKNNSLNATQYYWDLGNWNYSEQKDPVARYEESGVYDVCLVIYNENTECYADKCMQVKLASDTSMIFADFSYIIDNTTQKVLLTSRSSRNATDFYWTMGDGSFLQGAEVSKTYTIPGSYEVCLKAYNKKTLRSDQICKTFDVGTVTCNIVADFKYIIEDKKVKFNNKSIGSPARIYWDFGNGATSTVENPEYTFSTPGYYLVSLAVSNTDMSCADLTFELIKVGDTECKSDFSYTLDPETRKAKFANKSIGAIRNNYWSFGDYTFSIDKSPEHTYSEQGMYTASLTVLDSTGLCMDYYEDELQVGKFDCNASFTVMVDSANIKAAFKNKELGQNTLTLWSMGDGKILTDKNPVYQYQFPGYYTVSMSTYNILNGCMDYTQQDILVGNPNTDCVAKYIYKVEGRKITLNDKSKGNILKYYWNLGDGTYMESQGKKFEHTYTKPGIYNVCLLVVNTSGISNITCDWVSIAPDEIELCKADFNFTVDNSTKKVSFKDASRGKPSKWNWDFGNNTKTTTTTGVTEKTYAQSDYYLVGLNIETATGCKDVTYKLVNVGKTDAILKSAFGYEIDSANNSKAGGYPVDFIGTGIGDQAKLRWDFGDGSIDTSTMTPTHEFQNTGTYNVCFTLSDPVTKQTSQPSCKEVIIEKAACVDNAAPEILCKDTIVRLNAQGTLTITADKLVKSVTDDCSTNPTITASKTSFTKADIGVVNVTITAEDASGKKATCTSKVTVKDISDNIENSTLSNNLEAQPNPIIGNGTNLEYYIISTEKVTFKLYDLGNRLIKEVNLGIQKAGINQYYLDMGHIAQGSYILQMQVGDVSEQIILIRQ